MISLSHNIENSDKGNHKVKTEVVQGPDRTLKQDPQGNERIITQEGDRDQTHLQCIHESSPMSHSHQT